MNEINPVNPVNGDPTNPQWQGGKPQGAIAQVPSTFNLQQVLEFSFHIRRLPTVNFTVNKVNVPGVSLPAAGQETPFMQIPVPGDHVTYETLVLNFRIDEGMENYFELHKWLTTISGLRGGDAYGRLAVKPEYTGFGVTSEILVAVRNAQKNVVRAITYHDAWPTTLKMDQIFDATLQEVSYFSATAVFRFSTFDTSIDV
jgi:hypothetical protein